MKRLLLASVLAWVAATAGATTTSSLTLDQTAPRFGDAVSFSAIYPKEATRSVTTVQHENPDVDLRCYQAGVEVQHTIFAFPDETRNNDGTITGHTIAIALGGSTGNGHEWPSGAATCGAVLYYFAKSPGPCCIIHGVFLASVQFDVAE